MEQSYLQQSIFKFSPTGYVVVHPNAPFFAVEVANQAFLNACGSSCCELKGKSFLQTLKYQPLNISMQEIGQIKAALEHTRKLKIHSSISLASWDIDTFPVLDDHQELRFIVQNFRVADHTEKLQARIALEASELKNKEVTDQYNIVSKATNEAIWDWDIIGGSVKWNKGIMGIFGFDHTSYDHKWWFDRVHPEDVERVTGEIDLLVSTKKLSLRLEYRFRCADGIYKNVLDRGFLMFNKSGEPIRMIGSMQDVTERVNHVSAIEQQNLRLQEISWMQSHHVRAPLARVLGLSELLFDKINDETTKEILSHLIHSAAELDDVIRKIVKKSEVI